MLIWVFTALVISTIDSRSAKNTAAESLKTVTNLAITAQQARADETLSLIRRGDESVRKQSYYQRIDAMQQQLSEYLGREDAIDKSDLSDAEQLLRRWRAADDRISSYIAVGNYQAATQVALGRGEDDSTPAFDRLDEALGKGIDESREQLRSDILNARRVLSGATVGAAVLSVVGGDRGGAGTVATTERVPVMSVSREEHRALILQAVVRRGHGGDRAGGLRARRVGYTGADPFARAACPGWHGGTARRSWCRRRRTPTTTATSPRACGRSRTGRRPTPPSPTSRPADG